MSRLVIVLHQGQRANVLMPCNSKGYIHHNRGFILKHAKRLLSDGYRLALVDKGEPAKYITDVIKIDFAEPTHKFMYLQTGKGYETLNLLLLDLQNNVDNILTELDLFGTCTNFSKQHYDNQTR